MTTELKYTDVRFLLQHISPQAALDQAEFDLYDALADTVSKNKYTRVTANLLTAREDFLNRRDLEPQGTLIVTLVDEERNNMRAADDGGPRRDFLQHLLNEIIVDELMFVGCDNDRLLVLNMTGNFFSIIFKIYIFSQPSEFIFETYINCHNLHCDASSIFQQSILVLLNRILWQHNCAKSQCKQSLMLP